MSRFSRVAAGARDKLPHVAGRRKPKRTRRRAQLDLEAIGLVLLAGGVFLLGVVLPSLPTGQLGRAVRGAVQGRLGSGAYALPLPLVALGGLFLLRRSPRWWPRLLFGYLLLAAGVWGAVAMVAPGHTGSFGRALRAALGGAWGALAVVPALLVATVGLDLLLGWPPTRLIRGLLVSLVGAVRGGVKALVAARRRAKARAAFRADVALARRALVALDADLQALSNLYPGSGELDRWRGEVRTSFKRLTGGPGPEQLADARADLKAWQGAVKDFARDRAVEMVEQLKAEGARAPQMGLPVVGDGQVGSTQEALNAWRRAETFGAWAGAVKSALDEPVAGRAHAARALDRLRKTLALDLTGLLERHRRLTRERDLDQRALKGMSPRELARASADHGRRLTDYVRIEADAARLSGEAEAFEPWRALASDLQATRQAYADVEEVIELDDALASALDANGVAELSKLAGWREALSAVRARAESAASAAREAAAAAPAAVALAGNSDASMEETLLEPMSATEERFPETAAHVDRAPAVDPELEAALLDDGVEARRPDRAAAAVSLEAAGEAAAAAPVPEFGGIPVQVPPVALLDEPEAAVEEPGALAREHRERVRKIDETLSSFKLEGRVVAAVRGPTVTRFEVEPAPGEKIARFANLSDDLALAMAVGSVRIEAPIPGKSVIGLEVPNAKRELVRFREAAESGSFRRSKARLPIVLGKSIDGEMVVGDLAKMPHLLIAGSTGSGKSVAVNTLIGSLLYRFVPTELRLLMIDPKMVELTPFDGVPHLLRPVVTNPTDAAGVLLGAVAHMERRYKMMSKLGAKNLDQYNEKARNLDLPELPFIVLVIDELADLMITSPKEVESAIMRLAQMARATGMHLILATQRPSVDILTSLIKVNVPARMAFAVSSSHDSRTILDSMGAERLIGLGDMLFYQPGLVKAVRLQGPFVSEREVAKLGAFMRRQYFDDDFVEAYGADFDPPSSFESDASRLIDWNDDKLRTAAELVVNEGQASVSRLQRRLQVGHARAGKLMDSLEALGVVGPHQGSKPREVLIEFEDLPNVFGK